MSDLTFSPVITPMLESDLATAARFMYESQLQQATNRFLFRDWPNERGQMELYTSSMLQMFQDKTQYMYKVTTASGEMIASLILSRKTPSLPEEEETPKVAPPDQQQHQPSMPTSALNPEARPVMRSAMMSVQEPMRYIDHLALSTIFVKPEARIKGVGTQLVRFAIERAAAEGVPLFLCSVPSAALFYRKLGFKDANHADIDLTQWGPEYAGFENQVEETQASASYRTELGVDNG